MLRARAALRPDVREHRTRLVDVRRVAVQPAQRGAAMAEVSTDSGQRLPDLVRDGRNELTNGIETARAIKVSERVAQLLFGSRTLQILLDEFLIESRIRPASTAKPRLHTSDHSK
jgi:hypothetical protein